MAQYGALSPHLNVGQGLHWALAGASGRKQMEDVMGDAFLFASDQFIKAGQVSREDQDPELVGSLMYTDVYCC